MPDTIQVCFTAPERLNSEIKAYADLFDLSKSEASRKLIDLGLDRFDTVPENDTPVNPAALTKTDYQQSQPRSMLYDILTNLDKTEWAIMSTSATAEYSRGELIGQFVHETGSRVRRQLIDDTGRFPQLSDYKLGWVSLSTDYLHGTTDTILKPTQQQDGGGNFQFTDPDGNPLRGDSE